jgi:uroporphyrinogen decarboxylase
LTPKERFIAALNLEEPDKVPMFEYQFQSPEKVTGKANITNDLSFKLIAKGKRFTLIKHNLENEIDLCRKLGFDALYVDTTIPSGTLIEENVWMSNEGKRYVYNPAIDRTIIFEPEEPLSIRKFPVGIFDSVRLAQKLAPELALIVGGIGTVAPMPTGPDAVEVAKKYYTERENMKKEIEERTIKIIRNIDILTDFGVEIFRGGIDDIAGNHGPFLHPRLFDDLIFPYLKMVVDEVHKKGGWLMIHTDGNLWPILDNLVDTGIDALGQIDPSAGMDIGDVKEKYGDRIAIHGNIDCAWTLINMNPEDVVRETKKCILNASSGGGHILSTSNVIDKATPLQNALAMIKTGHKYGNYPLKLQG